MGSLYKIGVIGDKDSVLGFLAVGFAVFTAENASEAASALHRAAAGNFAVIFITEELAQQIGGEIRQYTAQSLPAIIAIPSKNGKTGYGMSALKKCVEHAVGADILFGQSK